MRFRSSLGAFLALLMICCPVAMATTLEPVGTFDQPITITSHPSDASRLLVAERQGTLVEVSASGTSTVADFGALVSCCAGERGVNSIALGPDFASTGRFYAAYAGTSAAGGEEGDLHIDAFRPDLGGGLIREPILTIDHDQHADHYGGQLQFGPDGNLYISVGDGAGGGDPLDSGQSLDTLLGKVLRIDPRPGETPVYAIPAGNPFTSALGEEEIWAYGLRNPWRFSFDRLSGDLVIADVGQALREEINFAPSPAAGVVGGAGANYGWNCREGLVAFPGAPESCEAATGFVDPVFDYTHTAPDGTHRCAVIGGYVSRDPGLEDLYGRYLYADLCSGEIRSLVLPSGAGMAIDDRSEGIELDAPVAFGEDALGRLYVASGEGPVYRLVNSPSSPGPTLPAAPPVAGEAFAPPTGPARPRLRLRRQLAGNGGVKLVAELIPCDGAAAPVVQLNKGGAQLATKRLGADCSASFFVRVRRQASFRALLQSEPAVRSRSVAVRPPARD